MPINIFGTIAAEVDDDGYLVDYQSWNLELAREIARQEGVPELTPRHLTVIEFVQRDFLIRGHSPNVYRITKESGVNTQELYALFPGGPAKKAAKIAGLKKPDSCV